MATSTEQRGGHSIIKAISSCLGFAPAEEGEDGSASTMPANRRAISVQCPSAQNGAGHSGCASREHEKQGNNSSKEPCSSDDRRRWIDSIKDQVSSWNFSAFDLDKLTNGNPLITITICLLEVHGLLDDWKLDRATVERFLFRVQSEYLPKPYHNQVHASDVTQTSAIIMQSVAKQLHEIPKLESFCVIIGAAVHDLGHLGVNNDFLINSKHPRATTYNDRSVNENYHISRAFELMRTEPGCDIFERLSKDEQKKCRKLMIDAVLATDMAIHFDLLKNFNEQISKQPDISQWEDRSLLYQMVVHLADIANPARPFHLARNWAERVIVEFCAQSDQEIELGLPLTPSMVRKDMNMPKAQQFFIEVFLRPTLMSFSSVTPDFTSMALRHLETTVASWKQLEAEGFKM